MKIDSLKDLQKLILLCRKLGVEAFEVGDIKFNLSPTPAPRAKAAPFVNMFPEADIKIPQYNPGVSNFAADVTADLIKTDELTEEQLLFYSATSEDQQAGQ